MPKTSPKKSTMTDAHKLALAKGREEGRIVRRYLEGIEAAKPRRGRKRTPDSINKRLQAIDERLPEVDPLTRLHLVQEKQQLERELDAGDDGVDISALEKDFIKVAKSYGERKGITYSAWRAVGVSVPVLQQAKIPRTRG
jgi:hypothetical protein